MERFILSFPSGTSHGWKELLAPWPEVTIRYLFDSESADVDASDDDVAAIRQAFPDLHAERVAKR